MPARRRLRQRPPGSVLTVIGLAIAVAAQSVWSVTRDPGQSAVAVVIALVFAGLALLVAWGLWLGVRLARWGVVLYVLLEIFFLVLMQPLLRHHESAWLAMLMVVVGIAAATLLWTTEAAKYFARDRRTRDQIAEG